MIIYLRINSIIYKWRLSDYYYLIKDLKQAATMVRFILLFVLLGTYRFSYSHLLYWLRQASSLTFWESKTQTSKVNARSCLLSELSRVSVEDSLTSSAKSPKLTSTKGKLLFQSTLLNNFMNRAGELTE